MVMVMVMVRYYDLGSEIVFDVLKRQVISESNVVTLGGRETLILKLLSENLNEVVSKEYIQEKVWGNVIVSDASLAKAVSNLRKSLSELDNSTFEIKTISKGGYVLILDESISDFFTQEKNHILDVKNIKQIKKECISNINDISDLSLRAYIPMKKLYLSLVCLVVIFLLLF